MPQEGEKGLRGFPQNSHVGASYTQEAGIKLVPMSEEFLNLDNLLTLDGAQAHEICTQLCRKGNSIPAIERQSLS